MILDGRTPECLNEEKKKKNSQWSRRVPRSYGPRMTEDLGSHIKKIQGDQIESVGGLSIYYVFVTTIQWSSLTELSLLQGVSFHIDTVVFREMSEYKSSFYVLDSLTVFGSYFTQTYFGLVSRWQYSFVMTGIIKWTFICFYFQKIRYRNKGLRFSFKGRILVYFNFIIRFTLKSQIKIDWRPWFTR